MMRVLKKESYPDDEHIAYVQENYIHINNNDVYPRPPDPFACMMPLFPLLPPPPPLAAIS
jgi:hypothetical protein